MTRALIKFSNGESLKLSEGETLLLFSKTIINNEVTVSQHKTFKVWRHHHDGLLTAILDMLNDCTYFQPIDETNKVYNPLAVVSVESL